MTETASTTVRAATNSTGITRMLRVLISPQPMIAKSLELSLRPEDHEHVHFFKRGRIAVDDSIVAPDDFAQRRIPTLGNHAPGFRERFQPTHPRDQLSNHQLGVTW